MIPVIYLGENKESRGLKTILEENHIEFKEKNIDTTTEAELKQLATEIRSIRPYLTLYGPTDRWDFNELILSPIIKTDFGTFPWWHIRQELDKIIHQLKAIAPKEEKKKLKIKKIKKIHATGVCLTANAIARINVTILRMINGINVLDIVNSWSLEERAAFTIAWRLCQHQKGNELRIFAEMLENKAEVSDPHANKNNEWIGDI